MTMLSMDAPQTSGARSVQRRANFRVKTKLWARIHLPMKMTVQLVDLSLGGARFDRELPCTPGVPLAFAIEVPELGDVAVTGTVVWTDSEAGTTGVQFTEMVGERAKPLQEALLAEERRNLRGRRATQSA